MSKSPSCDLLLPPIIFSMLFLVAVCSGAFGDLVVASAGVRKSHNEREYTAKLAQWVVLPLRRRSAATLGLLLLSLSGAVTTAEGANLRENITDGNVECIHYNHERRLFRMTCDVLEWRWDADTFLSLGANETFDGGSRGSREDGKGIIDLTGIENFKGLFTVDENDVESFAEAPLVRNVHVLNGKTAIKGGFIFQRAQRYFVVDSCSSTGNIEGNAGGGICGHRSGY
jgi:hypothetical protein